jgi:Phage integrase family
MKIVVVGGTISRMGRRVSTALTTNVLAATWLHSAAVVSSLMTASHSWKLGGSEATKACRRFSRIENVDYHVPMNDEPRAILRALPSRLRSPWVFPSASGTTALNSQNFINRVFRPALRRARISDFSWHDLRHTFASRLAMAGVPIRTIQELMGHQSLTMTLRYAHLSSAHKLDAVNQLVRSGSDPRIGTRTGTEGNPRAASAAGTHASSARPRSGKREWRRAGSNGRPRDYETLALAN